MLSRIVVAVLAAATPNLDVSPNNSIPGTSTIQSLIGGLEFLALLACVAAVVAGGGAWAWGQRQANITVAHHGRRLAEGGLIGGLLIGGAVLLVSQAFGFGQAF
jgi:hypothetical protein